MQEFNRKRCITNIIREAKEQGKKIGETEEKAGVSPGFLSRINNDDGKGNLDVKVFYSIAEQLGRTMDYLANYDEDAPLTENDQYILSFLDQLDFDTIRYNIEWEMMDPNIIDNPEHPINHPLFSMKTEGFEHPEINKYVEKNTYTYNSRFDTDVKISGHCFQADLDQFGRDKICIMSVKYWIENSNPFGSGYEDGHFEFYLMNEYKNITPLASSFYVCEQIIQSMEKLYQSIECARSHLTLNNKATKVINSYMRHSKAENREKEGGING